MKFDKYSPGPGGFPKIALPSEDPVAHYMFVGPTRVHIVTIEL